MSIIREERIGDCRLILGDCLDVMPTLGPVDAILSDPPYGINFCHAGGSTRGVAGRTKFNGQKIIGDDEPFDPSPLLDVAGSAILWGANHYADSLPRSSRWLLWDKRASSKVANDQADCELAWTNLRGVARVFRHEWNGMLRQTERGQPRVHPAQKPVALMSWCLGFLPDAQTILDPYAGSGSTGVAAVKQGRFFIGIERDPAYFQIMCDRIAEAYRQPRDMFVSAPAPQPKQETLL